MESLVASLNRDQDLNSVKGKGLIGSDCRQATKGLNKYTRELTIRIKQRAYTSLCWLFRQKGWTNVTLLVWASAVLAAVSVLKRSLWRRSNPTEANHGVMAFIPQLLAWVSLATCFAHAATSCTVKSVSVLESAKSACTTITLSNVAVPAGQTLDLTGLKSGTKVPKRPLDKANPSF